VPPKHQHLIMVMENCIPVQHEAHIARGNSKPALKKCAMQMFRNLSAARIGTWYRDLWKEHNLSVDKGFLVPARDMKVHQLVDMVELGAAIRGQELPKDIWKLDTEKGPTDYRAQVALRYQSRRRKWRARIPKEHNGFTIGDVKTFMDEGYWAAYMLRTMGLNGHVDNGHVVWYT